MPTQKRRIAITPSDHLRGLLDQLSSITGQPVASMCAELLEESVPVIEDMLRAQQQLSESPDRLREVIEAMFQKGRADIDAAMREVAQANLDLPEQDGRRRRGPHARRAK